MAYASLYKSYGETVDAIKADDVTVSIIREVKPKKLLKYLEEHGYIVTNPHKGIYYIKGKTLFSTQIVVTKELDSNAHRWIKALSLKLNKVDLSKLFNDKERMTEKTDREFANSVLVVSIEANMEIAEELRGGGSMNAGLMEWVRPQLEDQVQAEVRASRIKGSVETLQDLGFEDKEIETKIIEKYGLTAEEATKYLQS